MGTVGENCSKRGKNLNPFGHSILFAWSVVTGQ